MEPTPSPQDQQQDQEIIALLKALGSVTAEYPPDLLAARRAAFVGQVEEKAKEAAKREERRSRKEFTKRLASLSSVKEAYPSELLSARRAAFVAQVEKLGSADVPALVDAREELASQDQEIIRLLKNIKTLEPDYSPRAFAARRSAFQRQMARAGSIGFLDVLRSSVQNLIETFQDKVRIPAMPTLNVVRTSLVFVALIMIAFASSLLFGNRGPALRPAATTQEQVAQPSHAIPTNTEQLTTVICKPGFLPPLCLAKEFDKSDDLTFAGNGSARPAVAKDTRPGYHEIHRPSNVNDGLYGPGASWVSNSPNSWIKIDLGKPTTINTVAFGRDRLGELNDGDPGQFVIAVAMSDDVYADGISTNDFVEYTKVFDSKQAGFDGVVSGDETIRAQFAPIEARYIKITFQNAGTAVDEVEAFLARPPALADIPTHKPRENVHVLALPPATDIPVLANSPTPVPTDMVTSAPTDTAVPTDTPIPTDTRRPTDTSTPPPTNTPRPTRTPTPLPTNTPRPTRTPIPLPTDTPFPTDTPVPVPTDTALPTDTPLPPPPDTPVPLPTDTIEPSIAAPTEPPFVGP